jgi:hypothetical protein
MWNQKIKFGKDMGVIDVPPTSHSALPCCFCQKSTGLQVPCNHSSGCKTTFHVSCLVKEGGLTHCNPRSVDPKILHCNVHVVSQKPVKEVVERKRKRVAVSSSEAESSVAEESKEEDRKAVVKPRRKRRPDEEGEIHVKRNSKDAHPQKR